MEREYAFLCEFSNNTHPSENHLVKRYGASALLEAITEAWIVPYGTNTLNETLYTITPEGKARRDE